MANPLFPLQTGSNLPGLETQENIQDAQEQDAEMQMYEDALGLDPSEVEEEVIELDDGSVVVNFKPKESPNENPEFYANLAEVLDESVLQSLAIEYLDYIDVDQESRKQRDKQYEEGLRRTGLGKDAPGGATFDGASKVVHPVMAEACVDFAASSAKELLPPDGIVKSSIKGEADREKGKRRTARSRSLTGNLRSRCRSTEMRWSSCSLSCHLAGRSSLNGVMTRNKNARCVSGYRLTTFCCRTQRPTFIHRRVLLRCRTLLRIRT